MIRTLGRVLLRGEGGSPQLVVSLLMRRDKKPSSSFYFEGLMCLFVLSLSWQIIVFSISGS